MKETYELAVKLYEDSLRAGAPPDICQCCGAHIVQGVQGCFSLFADVLALGYADPTYAAANFYGVDAHALQHPEVHGKKNNAAHLLRLHWIFERGEYARAGTVPRWWQNYLQGRDIPLLEPPRDRGPLTIVDVAPAATAAEHADRMQAWARAVHAAWHPHHAWATRELARLLK